MAGGTTLTTADEWTSVRVPDDGQEVTAAQDGIGQGPVRPGYQSLGNRTQRLLNTLAYSHLQQQPYLRSTDGADILVGPTRILLADGTFLATTGETPVTQSSGGHIYARVVAGVLTFSDEVQVPDVWQATKQDVLVAFGQTDRRYIGSWPYNRDTGLVEPFTTSVGGRCQFAGRIQPAGIASVTLATWAIFDLTADLLPLHARHVSLSLDMQSDDVALTCLLRPDGVDGAASARQVVCPASGAPSRITHEITLPVVARKIQARLTAAAAGSFVAIFVTGWE